MAIATSKLIVKMTPLPATTPSPEDRVEAISEHIYNIAQDNVRSGYIDMHNYSSSRQFYDGHPLLINARGGDDTVKIFADAVDEVHAGSGHDYVDTGGGSDKLYGGSGNDSLFGNDGNDTLSGGSDDDELLGGYGNDGLSGGSGQDELYGEYGNDTLNGGSGDDFIFGGQERDTLNGGSGNDQLCGDKFWSDVWFTGGAVPNDGSFDDVLNGGSGDDELIGGEGADIMTGGTGADLFTFNAAFDFGSNDRFDVITDFNRGEGDKINLLYVGGPNLTKITVLPNEREYAHFTDGPSGDYGSVWLGSVDANGDQFVYMNWQSGELIAGEPYDYKIKVNVGVGNSLMESDFIF